MVSIAGVYCEIALCQRNETITNDGTDEIEVVFALDRSGSMTAPMFKVAKEFIYSIVLGLQTEYFIKVGVVSFAADARLGTHCLNTSDRFIFRSDHHF